MRARQEILCYMKVLIHQTPRLQSQRCTPWCLQWQSTHEMDVCRNATSMQLSRKDPAEEAGVDCIPTHKSQHILSGCLLGAKCPLTILLIQWKYDPPCNSVTWLLCVQAALLFNTTTTTTTSFSNDNNSCSKNSKILSIDSLCLADLTSTQAPRYLYVVRLLPVWIHVWWCFIWWCALDLKHRNCRCFWKDSWQQSLYSMSLFNVLHTHFIVFSLCG